MEKKNKSGDLPCCICGRPIDRKVNADGTVWRYGHNAMPVGDGRCCTRCNDTVVRAAREGFIARRS